MGSSRAGILLSKKKKEKPRSRWEQDKDYFDTRTGGSEGGRGGGESGQGFYIHRLYHVPRLENMNNREIQASGQQCET